VLVVHVLLLLIVVGARGARIIVFVGQQLGRGSITEHQRLHR
jgi:hypothetical protein